jgi:hypothetical protein
LGRSPPRVGFSTTKDVTASIQSIFTVLGLVAAGAFAYYKWVWSARERTFFPRMELAMTPTRVRMGQRDGAICHLSVKNYGNDDAIVLETGTGVSIDMAAISPDDSVSWLPGAVQSLALGNTEISPEETHHDETLVLLGGTEDVVRLRTRIVWNWKGVEGPNYQELSVVILPPLVVPPVTFSGTVEPDRGG